MFFSALDRIWEYVSLRIKLKTRTFGIKISWRMFTGRLEKSTAQSVSQSAQGQLGTIPSDGESRGMKLQWDVGRGWEEWLLVGLWWAGGEADTSRADLGTRAWG